MKQGIGIPACWRDRFARADADRQRSRSKQCARDDAECPVTGGRSRRQCRDNASFAKNGDTPIEVMSALGAQAEIGGYTSDFCFRLGLFDTCPRAETAHRTAWS